MMGEGMISQQSILESIQMSHSNHRDRNKVIGDGSSKKRNKYNKHNDSDSHSEHSENNSIIIHSESSKQLQDLIKQNGDFQKQFAESNKRLDKLLVSMSASNNGKDNADNSETQICKQFVLQQQMQIRHLMK